MEFTITDLRTRLSDLLQDTAAGGLRWPDAERDRWILDAQQAIIGAWPMAGQASESNWGLQANLAMQRPVFPAGTRAVIDVTCNVVGGVQKDTIRYISRKQMDEQRPNWTREAASSRVRYWMPNDGDPLSFYVYPLPKVGTTVRVTTVAYPTTAGQVTIRQDFKAAVLHLAAALCFLKEDTSADAGKARTHLDLAANAMRAAGVADEQIIAKIVNRTPPK